jgi:hypothetical protein
VRSACCPADSALLSDRETVRHVMSISPSSNAQRVLLLSNADLT